MAPVVAGISVIGTIAGISERQAEANKRNAAVSAQQAATTKQEFLRLQSIEQQRRFAMMQHEMETMQRYAQANMQILQLNQQLAQAELQAAGQISDVARQQKAAELQNLAQNFDALRKEFEAQQKAKSVEVGAANQAANEFNQLANQNAALTQALQNGDTSRAAALAAMLARGEANQAAGTTYGRQSRSDKTNQSKAAQQLDLQGISQALQMGQMDDKILQNLMTNVDFAAILQKMGMDEATTMRQLAGLGLDQATSINNTNMEMLNRNSGFNRYATQQALGMIPGQTQIGQNQANINLGWQDLALDNQGTDVSMGANAQRWGLESQRVSTPGFLSNLAAIAGSAMPLLSSMSQQQQAQPSMLEQFNSREGHMNYSNNMLSIMTDPEITRTSLDVAQLRDIGYGRTTIPKLF